MVSIWFFIVWSFVAIIIGMVMMAGLLVLLTYVSGKIRKRTMPDDKETLKDGGPVTMNQKEVEENERKRIRNFREFEKLRQKHIKDKSRRTDSRREERTRELKGIHDATGPKTIGKTDTKSDGKDNTKPGKDSRRIKIIGPSDVTD